MSNWCCQTWRDLGDELAIQKITSLDKLLKRGIPKSTFSPIYRILEGITNFCPLCGESLNAPVESKPKKRENVQVKSEPIVSTVPDTIKCPPCKGTGRVGDGLNCMTCLGVGKLDKANPHRAEWDAQYAKELAEKMERNNQKIALIEKELKSNPKPLREDAKPENWAKI